MPELTVERLFSDPPLFAGLAQNPQFSSDGRHVAYLRLADDDRERMDLWRIDLETGEHACWLDGRRLQNADAGDATAEERAERERRRQFASGITSYAFCPAGRRLLMPVDGAAWIMDLDSGALDVVTPPDTRQTDMRFSPDGTQICYVRKGNLYRYDLEQGRESALTADGGGPISNGLADFIAQEEMHRFDGYWWSPDGAYLAFTRVDESPINESLRYEIEADAICVVSQRYPYAGEANADVRLLVTHLESGETREIPYRIEQDDYLARVGWLSGRLAVQRQSRNQRSLELHLFDPTSGDGQRLLAETSATWVNLHDNLRVLPGNASGEGNEHLRFLWTSERTGRSHLYLYDDGILSPLTHGNGRVNRLLWADDSRALLSGWHDSPTEQHLFEVTFDGSEPARRLTHQAGWHEPVVSPDGKRVLDRFSNLHVPARLSVLSAAGQDGAGSPRTLLEDVVGPGHPYAPYAPNHATPDLGTLTSEDGQTLCYRLTTPDGPVPDGGFPVIVYVYGGPGAQRVRNEWPPLLLQLLSGHGYGVLELDNRGSGNRERRFEAPLHRHMGGAEVRDQVRGARFLATLPWVNPRRIGVFGHSYGGYMTLMCLMQAPEVFRAGVAVAPVTDWRLYDTHYTERYLQTPEANPDGYRDSDVLSHADRLAGKLLLIHGMADDNVLFTHTTKLMRALQARTIPFEMMAYPGSKHGLHERDVSIHRFNLLLDFFARTLD